MGLFDNFPYTNFHELNLMWILEALKEIQTTTEQFVAINSLKYADPIQWNIVKQYEKNTIVIDPLTGTAYISVQPVPSGVALTNTDYWTVVFDLGSFVTRAAKNFTDRWEDSTTLTATFPTAANDWLVWGDTLYKAVVNITAGDQYVVDSNIKHFTIEDVIGHLEDLTTTDKTNLVAAINEIITKAGDLADLDTTDKSNLVAAINEVLQTLKDTAGDLDDLTTDNKSDLVSAINEIDNQVHGKIGDLDDLTTDDKDTLVNAINDVDDLITTLNDTLARRRIIHVRDFGAVGDGVTDDTDAIQAAFNYNADNLLKTVIIDPGRYHTTRPLVMPPYLYVTCESYCEGCFLDTFPLGTIQLNNGCWIENVLFLDDEHPNEETYAIYGTNVQGVSITHVQMSGATIGSSSPNPTSGFLSLVGNWSIIMIKDCLVDAGGATQFAFHLEGMDNWDPSVHPFGDRDIFIRDCFLDNFQPVAATNLGGLFYIDSINDVRLQGCICRCSTNTFVIAKTKADNLHPQDCAVYASNCLIERSSTTGYGISIGSGCRFENLGSVLGKNTYILNDNELIQYDVSKAIYSTVPAPNKFTLDANVTVLRQGNGTFFIEHTAAAVEDSVGARFNVATDKFVRTMLSYYGDLTNESRYGLMFNDGTNDIYFYVNPFNNNLVVNKWNNQVYVEDVLTPQLVNIPSVIGLGCYIATNRVIFYVSYDNVYWREIGEYFCTPPATMKMFANDGVVGNKFELQLLSLDISD